MEWEKVLHDDNTKQSFASLPLKPNNQRKTRVRMIESHPIQHSPGINFPMELPVEPSGTRHSSQIDVDSHPADHHLG
jgi:hypothetical protein